MRRLRGQDAFCERLALIGCVVHNVVNAISTATTGSIHFLRGDLAGFSAIGITTC
jgi:hypothetical protein